MAPKTVYLRVMLGLRGPSFAVRGHQTANEIKWLWFKIGSSNHPGNKKVPALGIPFIV